MDKRKLTVAEITELAREQNLGSRRIRSLLHRHGHDPGVEAPKVRAALGRDKQTSGEEPSEGSPPP